ncbi:MAG: 30S ribosome-binding factor RbfA [Methylocystaceae bacterium]
MGARRNDRLAEEIKREMSQIFREEMKDPRLNLVSITRVEVSSELSHARIFVSVIGDEEERRQVDKALQGAKGYLRTEIGSRLQVRRVPELVFRIDRSIEHGVHIASLLNQIKKEQRPEIDFTDER